MTPNFEIYVKTSLTNGLKIDHTLAQFEFYSVMLITLDSIIKVYGDEVYVRAITNAGQSILGKLSHKASYIASSPDRARV